MVINKKFIAGIIVTVITVIVLFTIVGNTGTDIAEAGESITDANNCSEFNDEAGIAFSYNASDSWCYNSSTGVGNNSNRAVLAGQYDLPLSGLFAGTGVIILIFMAMFLLLIFKKVAKK